MPGYGKWKYEEIPINADQLLAYKNLCEELWEKYRNRYDDLTNRDWEVEDHLVMPPRWCKYWGGRKQTKCCATNETIYYGQEAVIIIADIIEQNRKITLGIFKSRDAFFEMLSRY